MAQSLKIAQKHPGEVFYQLYKQGERCSDSQEVAGAGDVETRGAVEVSGGAGGSGPCDGSARGEVV
jgi:hypothetical protein